MAGTTVLNAPGTPWQQGRGPGAPTMPRAQEISGQDPRLAMAAASQGADTAKAGLEIGTKIQDFAKNLWEQQKAQELKTLGQQYEERVNVLLTGEDVDGEGTKGVMHRKGYEATGVMGWFDQEAKRIAEDIKNQSNFGGRNLEALDLMFNTVRNNYTRSVASHQMQELRVASIEVAKREEKSQSSQLALAAPTDYQTAPDKMKDRIEGMVGMVVGKDYEIQNGKEAADLRRVEARQQLYGVAIRSIIKSKPEKAMELVASMRDGTNPVFGKDDVPGDMMVEIEREARDQYKADLMTRALVLTDSGQGKSALAQVASDPELSGPDRLKIQDAVNQRAKYNQSLALQQQAMADKAARNKGMDAYFAGGKLNDVSIKQLQDMGLKGEVLYQVWTAGQSMLASAASGQKTDLHTLVTVMSKVDSGEWGLADLTKPENAETLQRLGHSGFTKVMDHVKKVGNMGEDGKRNYGNAKEVFKGTLSGLYHGNSNKDELVAQGMEQWEIMADQAAEASGGWGNVSPEGYADLRKNLLTKVLVPGSIFGRSKTFLELLQTQQADGSEIPKDMKDAIESSFVRRFRRRPNNNELLKAALRPENQEHMQKLREKNWSASGDDRQGNVSTIIGR